MSKPWLVSVLAVACGCAPAARATGTPQKKAARAAVPEVPPSQPARPARTAEVKPVTASPPSLNEIVCEGRARCERTGTIGAPLAMGEVTHSVERFVIAAPERQVAPSDDEERDGTCDAEEFWLVAQNAAHQVVDHQLLSGGCVDNERSRRSWCGTAPHVEVEVSGDEVTASAYSPQFPCMGAFRSSVELVASLRTFQTLKHSSSSWHSLAGYSNHQEWSWPELRGGRGFGYAFEPQVPSDTAECPNVAVDLPVIPAFEVDAAFAADGWASTNLAGCSTKLDARSLDRLDPKKAAQLRAEPASARTVLEALVDTQGHLFLALHPVKAPSANASIEVCAGDETYYDSGYCTYGEPAECARFMLDGTLLSNGKEAKLQVDKARSSLQYRVTLPTTEGSLKLLYRDPGTSEAIRTSTRATGKSFSLSEVVRFDPKQATCAMHNGGLQLVRQRPPKDHALTVL